MLIGTRKGWEISDRLVTPETLVMGRRTAMAGAAGLAAAGIAAPARAEPNPRYPAGRAITPEADVTTYNNFYEFGTDKSIYRAAQKLQTSPWTVEFAGLVDKPRKMDLDDLLKQVTLEERVYRHRCVETWAMTVPWTGFPLKDLVAYCAPTASAKYITFETKQDPKTMPGPHNPLYPWPYLEGLTMAEATNELPFMVTGMYGKPVPPQNGGPLRVVLPWKYGFKSAKAIVKITLTDKRPDTFWEAIQSSEYGFWANVNPKVPHPRWSQATERLLGTDERVPTLLYNGYADQVAPLYANRQKEALFM
jgi:sulfoxide reductase catalytic subunit YedY